MHLVLLYSSYHWAASLFPNLLEENLPHSISFLLDGLLTRQDTKHSLYSSDSNVNDLQACFQEVAKDLGQPDFMDSLTGALHEVSKCPIFLYKHAV